MAKRLSRVYEEKTIASLRKLTDELGLDFAAADFKASRKTGKMIVLMLVPTLVPYVLDGPTVGTDDRSSRSSRKASGAGLLGDPLRDAHLDPVEVPPADAPV